MRIGFDAQVVYAATMTLQVKIVIRTNVEEMEY